MHKSKLEEIIFIAPLPVLNKRTRLAKMAQLVREQNLKLRYFGWERESGESKAFPYGDSSVIEKTLLRGGGYSSNRTRILYPLWMLLVFWQVLRLGRGQVIFALGWETAFPARLAAFFTGAQIVFDDADRFSMILLLPEPFHRLLKWLECWTSRNVALHIIPGFSRYEWHHEKMIVLRNTPLAKDFEAASTSAPSRPNAALVVYANGWIGETRGAPVFLKALDLAAEQELDLLIIIAGRLDGKSARRLKSHPMVKYLGEMSQKDALKWYPACDLVITFYDPVVPINLKAESNKWGDAIFFGCPFVVNSEVETARVFTDKNAAWSVPYHDAEALVDLFVLLAASPEERDATRKRLAQFTQNYPTFDLQMKKILNDVLPRECVQC